MQNSGNFRKNRKDAFLSNIEKKTNPVLGLFWLDDDESEAVTGHVVAVHSGYQSARAQIRRLFLLKIEGV